MKENYFINIESKQKFEKSEDKTALKTIGSFSEVRGKKYITYKEYEDDNPQNFKLCVIKLEGENQVTLIKNGVFQSKLILEKNKRHYSPYYTDYGMLTLGVTTRDIKSDFKTGGGRLSVKYSLDINSGFVSMNEVTVEVEKMDKQGEKTCII